MLNLIVLVSLREATRQITDAVSGSVHFIRILMPHRQLRYVARLRQANDAVVGGAVKAEKACADLADGMSRRERQRIMLYFGLA